MVKKYKRLKVARVYFYKMRGKSRDITLCVPSLFELFISFLGAFLGIASVAILSLHYQLPLLVASFGASAVLLYGLPQGLLSQPRNVFGGHVFSAIVGVTVNMLFGVSWWSAALATALAITIMLVTQTTHPPGGATALVAVLSEAKIQYIFFPVATGSLILIIIALIVNNLSPNRRYPTYWI